uniref:Serpentine receptor class gamma n=1 Tax=Globodera rostochiensis TaxID=31243 RepID=A0A914I0H0_GLORO
MFLNDFCGWILRNQITLIGLATCVTLPSVLLYIAEIVTVLRHKQFHSSFFALFTARALADLLHTLNSYFNYKLTVSFGNLLFGIYLEFPNWVLTLSIFLGMYSFQTINLATVFISFNRLSIVLVPLNHDKLWSVALLPASILITFVAPLANLIFVVKMDVTLVTSTTNSSFSFIMAEGPKTNLLPLITDISSAIASLSLIICLIVNFGTLLQYKRKINVAAEMAENQRMERKLGIYALHTFAGHMTVSVMMIGMSISHKIGIFTAVMTIYSQYAYVMDWCTIVLSSWLLLWASSSFREQFVADFVPKWLQTIMIEQQQHQQSDTGESLRRHLD